MDLEGRLLRRRGEAAADALLQTGHQDAVAEPLPALLGLVDRHDRPATGRGAGRVEDLAFRQAVPAGVHRRDRGLILLLGPAGHELRGKELAESGFSLPQPTRISVIIAASSSCSAAVRGRRFRPTA